MRQHATTCLCAENSSAFAFFRTSDGIALRTGHWVTPSNRCRGTIVILNGRAEFMEKYFETIQQFNQRGFDVFSFDWRGQGLSDRLLNRRTQGHVGDYAHYLGDLSQIVQKVVIPRSRGDVVFLGHSMGGHLSIRYTAWRPAATITKMVLCAPMLGIQTRPVPTQWLKCLSQWMVRRGLGHLNVPISAINPYQSFSRNRMTSDPERYQRILSMLSANPALKIEGITFGWLAASFVSLSKLNQECARLPVDLPILILSAECDRVVRNDKILEFVRMSPERRLVRIDRAKHEILQERDELRSQFWRAFDEFMAS
jgi:lysophospholipase